MTRRQRTKRTDWILVTGQPSCGKTTAVKRICTLLQKHGVRCQGFYTEEVLRSGGPKGGVGVGVGVGGVGEKGIRDGFDLVTIPDGKRGMLSRKNGPSKLPKTGNYSVFVESFEKLALPTLESPRGEKERRRRRQDSHDEDDNEDEEDDNEDDEEDDGTDIVYILDEIGRMELHSDRFPTSVRTLLDRGVRLVGAITAPRYGHRVPFCDEIGSAKGVRVYNLTKSNRDDVVASLMKDVKNKWIDDKTCSRDDEDDDEDNDDDDDEKEEEEEEEMTTTTTTTTTTKANPGTMKTNPTRTGTRRSEIEEKEKEFDAKTTTTTMTTETVKKTKKKKKKKRKTTEMGT